MMKASDDSPTNAGRTARPAEVRVWDPLVRIFHWSVAAGFLIAWLAADDSEAVHVYAGYVVLALIAVRVVWGLIGTKHARFSDFVYRPSTIVGFLKDMKRLRTKRYIGHNPAGGAMVIVLLIAVAAVSITGYMMTTDAYWGVAWVEELHGATVDFALILIGLHILGVLFASFEHGENLVRSMVTGKKRER